MAVGDDKDNPYRGIYISPSNFAIIEILSGLHIGAKTQLQQKMVTLVTVPLINSLRRFYKIQGHVK